MKTAPRFIAVFPEDIPILPYISNSRVVVEMMGKSQTYAGATPSLTQVGKDLDTLEDHEHDVQQGGKGTVQQRNQSLDVVRCDMRLLKAFVQGLADTQGPTKGEGLIIGAGMQVRRKSSLAKPPLRVRRGDSSGLVKAYAKAAGSRSVYQWQLSEDGETWTTLPQTLVSKTSIEALTPAKVYWFRHRIQTRKGLTEWSDPVSITVL